MCTRLAPRIERSSTICSIDSTERANRWSTRHAPTGFPVFVVHHKVVAPDGTVVDKARPVVDIWGLRKASQLDIYPMRTQDEIVRMCQGARFISVLDAKGFFLPMACQTRARRAPSGHLAQRSGVFQGSDHWLLQLSRLCPKTDGPDPKRLLFNGAAYTSTTLSSAPRPSSTTFRIYIFCSDGYKTTVSGWNRKKTLPPALQQRPRVTLRPGTNYNSIFGPRPFSRSIFGPRPPSTFGQYRETTDPSSPSQAASVEPPLDADDHRVVPTNQTLDDNETLAQIFQESCSIYKDDESMTSLQQTAQTALP